MSDEQPTLFDLPEPPRRPRLRVPPKVASYTRYRAKRRRLCDDCIADIHVRGLGVAPLPMSVRWKRISADGTALLCETHADERRGADRGDA